MKRLFGFALIALSLSLPAFAAKNSQDLTLYKTVKVGATQLPEGNYKVTWTGNDANVQVTIAKNGKTVATAPAKVVPAKNGSVSVSTRSVNGTEVLETIQLDKLNLVLTGAPANGE